MNTIDVEVTQEDIDNGIPCRSKDCMLALAVQRVFPDSEVFVGSMMFTVVGPEEKELSYSLPDEAVAARRKFDCVPNAKSFLKPFKFTATLKQ